MRVSEQLVTFSKEALAAGKSRDEIRSALTAAGWMDSEIEAALAAWSDVEFIPPVPRPTPYVSAKEAFFFVLMYVVFALTVWALISLGFTLAVGLVRVQDGIDFQVWRYGELSNIRWTMSALIVAFPIFLSMNVVSQRRIIADPAKQRSQIQKWLGFLALAVATLSLVGDGVWIIFRLISGSLTTLFVYRSLIVAVIATSVLAFFTHENREPGKKSGSLGVAGLNAYQAVFMTLVGISVVGGWVASDGLAGARAEARDEERSGDLQRLVEFVKCVADGAGGQLPSQLTDNNKCRATSRMKANDYGKGFDDRFTGEPYKYIPVSEFEFQVCAKIERPEAAGFFFKKYDAPWACADVGYRPPRQD